MMIHIQATSLNYRSLEIKLENMTIYKQQR